MSSRVDEIIASLGEDEKVEILSKLISEKPESKTVKIPVTEEKPFVPAARVIGSSEKVAWDDPETGEPLPTTPEGASEPIEEEPKVITPEILESVGLPKEFKLDKCTLARPTNINGDCVYLIWEDEGRKLKRWVSTLAIMEKLDLDMKDVKTMPDLDLRQYQELEALREKTPNVF